MKNNGVYFIGVLIAVGLLILLGWYSFTLTGFSIVGDMSGADFALGTFENSSFNGTAVILDGTNVTGAFTSRIFNTTTNAHWNNISWNSGGDVPVFFVRSCDDATCSGDPWNQIVLSSPSNLIVSDAPYFQYRALLVGSSALYRVDLDYTLQPLNLTLALSSPASESVYGYNESLFLNYSVGLHTPDQCWYSIDGGANVSLPGCTNTLFSVPGDGLYVLTLYANASDGTVSMSSSQFQVQTNAPTVVLVSPPNNAATNSSLAFMYYVNNSELTGCSLLSNLSGSWGASDTNSSPDNNAFNSFSTTAPADGQYSWGIECDDIAAQVSQTLNRSIIVDNIKPAVAITQPTGTFTSKANIPIALSVTDASTATCIYTLTRVGVGSLLVVVMPRCQGTSFNVADDGNYVLAVTVTDAAGNSNTQTSSFTVQSNSDSGSSGGGGGGGGVSVDVSSLVIPQLNVSPLDRLSLKPGFSQSVVLGVSNSGNTFLNGCHVVGVDQYSSWVGSEGFVSLSSGQQTSFNVSVTIPREQSPGIHTVLGSVMCDEFNKSFDIPLNIVPADFLFSITGYVRDATRLIVNYSLEELTGNDQTIPLHYVLRNADGIEVTSGDLEVTVPAQSTALSFFSFELPKDAFGEFELDTDLTTATDHLSVSHPVFLSSSKGTGFVISGANKAALSWIGVIVVIAGALYGGWYYLRKKRASVATV